MLLPFAGIFHNTSSDLNVSIHFKTDSLNQVVILCACTFCYAIILLTHTHTHTKDYIILSLLSMCRAYISSLMKFSEHTN